MLVLTFPVGPLGCNCTILADPESRDAIVVDPGGDYEQIRDQLLEHELKVNAIVHTHTHIDHVGATAPLQRDTGAEAMIHEADRFLYDMLDVQAAFLRLPTPTRCELSGALVDQGSLRCGSLEVGVFHTPGHTPGSVCFYCQDAQGKFVFTGDTLFARSIGRTDLWGGDSEQILHSLQNKLLTLADDTTVIPGHGRATSIGAEKRQNPYLAGLRR